MSEIAKTAIIDKSVVIGNNVVIKDYVVIYQDVVIEDNVEIMEGSVIGRLPKGANAVARKPQDTYSLVRIKKNSVISPHCIILR